MKPRVEIDMFRDCDIDRVRNYEVIFNVKKNKLEEFEGKVREVPQGDSDESQQSLIVNQQSRTTLDEGGGE